METIPITIINMTPRDYQCAMCDEWTVDEYAIPWYCGPVRSGQSEGGYRSVCKPCHDKWEAWDDSFDDNQAQAGSD